jgi:hypothetical protein
VGGKHKLLASDVSSLENGHLYTLSIMTLFITHINASLHRRYLRPTQPPLPNIILMQPDEAWEVERAHRCNTAAGPMADLFVASDGSVADYILVPVSTKPGRSRIPTERHWSFLVLSRPCKLITHVDTLHTGSGHATNGEAARLATSL